MIHVNGRSLVVMDSVTERMRLKDKIVANVAKAVKSIQELQMLAGSGTVTLGNQDWQCHRLCEHLDHTLLHGLRHVTPGYWKLVCEFTHKDCIKEIKRMRNVTTDLGRGRAWLFTALNENLLECYLNCFQQNESLVEEYYVRDALVRDQDRFNVLLTLTSGLENISFDLERDVAYLDLCVHPPTSKRMGNVEATVEFDRLSICSMESVHFPTNTKPLPQTVFENHNSYIPAYQPPDTISTGSGGSGHSPSVDSGVHSDLNFRQRSITPIDQLATVVSTEDNGDTANPAELEVIRLSKKGKPHKHKRKKKRFVSVSSVIDSELPDAEEATDGPVIEIPPLDDFKLISAIQSSHPPEHDQYKALTSDTRHPGDGVEHIDEKSGVVRPGSPKLHDTGDNETGGGKGARKDSVNKLSPNRDSGIFTEMIRSKVNDLVEAGDKANGSSGNSEDESEDAVNGKRTESVQYDSSQLPDNASSEFLSDIGIRPSYIYENKKEDNEEVIQAVDKEEPSVSVSEEASIYATRHDSDMSSDEEDWNAPPPSLQQESDDSRPGSRPASTTVFGSRSSKTPSRASITPPRSTNSTPVHAAIGDLKKQPSSSSIKSEDVQNSSEGRSTPDHVVNYDSANSDVEQKNKTTPRHTPDFMATRGSRPSSAVSRASTNEMSGNEEAAYQLSGNPIHQTYRDSPMESTDDEKTSLRTRSSNATPDSEIAAAETVLQAKVEELIEHKSLNTYTHLTFGEEGDEDQEEIDRTRSASAFSLRAGEVELDNNSMLYIMLDVVEGDDVFVRMFCCRQGHTEGKTVTVFVLVTTDSLYLLQQQAGKKRFNKVAEIPFTDIDFVSLGFNNQVLHIACKSKRNKYWLTTGEERVTIALVDCLADSMEKSCSNPARLEVDTGNTIQKISLQKYVASECHCEPHSEDAEVMCYSLVHWEDPSSSTASCEWDREGPVCYKSAETTTILGTQTWRLAHAVLKDSMLCMFNDKSDSKPSAFLSISGGQCVGCKRDFNADKNHAIKVIMEDGSFWTVALETEDEANRWLQALCQAVSEGMKMNTVRSSCIPCVLLLSQQKLLMCHEDVETNFLRTLGSASLADVSGVLEDDLNNTYLILSFESPEENVSNEQWVLYFNSDHECNRFRTCLSHCWAGHYQVEVPVLPMDDFALQKKCREMATFLKDSVTLR